LAQQGAYKTPQLLSTIELHQITSSYWCVMYISVLPLVQTFLLVTR
jgi:hypothetical protein